MLADIDGWLPKVAPGGWLSGDDYDEQWWPGVVAAVRDRLPDAQECSTRQWRWVKPVQTGLGSVRKQVSKTRESPDGLTPKDESRV